jgi:phosphate starvation-inducible PhoH-like protein
VPLSREDIQLTAIEMKNAARAAASVAAVDQPNGHADGVGTASLTVPGPTLRTRKADLQGRSPNQHAYLRHILAHDITVRYRASRHRQDLLAVACAADALERDAVQRIILTRPAVEAGERLGFCRATSARRWTLTCDRSTTRSTT